jgi:hypothetical protein
LIVAAALLILPAIDDTRSDAAGDAFASLRLLFSRATLQVRSGLHASFVALALLHAAFFGADAYVALLLTGTRGLSLESASICITLAALGWSLAAFAQPKLLERFGAASTVAGGALALCAATGAMVAVALGAPLLLAFAAWTLGGMGIGLAYATISLAALSASGGGDEGAISSATLLAALLGTLCGIGACGVPVMLAAHGGAGLANAMVVTFAIGCAFGGLLLALAPRLLGATRAAS